MAVKIIVKGTQDSFLAPDSAAEDQEELSQYIQNNFPQEEPMEIPLKTSEEQPLDLDEPLEELTLPAEEPIDPFVNGDQEAPVVEETAGEDVPGKAILDFIGDKEAPKGYNQVFGKNKEIPLDEMTIDEVLDWQLEEIKGGTKSSAVGRYQFLRKTLLEIKDKLNISGDTKMTPEVQDDMGQYLLERRGYNRYLRGTMSKEDFANSLAKEWASLPIVTDIKRGNKVVKKGSSYYAGDGLNKSLTGVDDYLTTISLNTTNLTNNEG